MSGTRHPDTSAVPRMPRRAGPPSARVLAGGLRCAVLDGKRAGLARGFTLMEMLLALAISAIVLAGIGGVFFSAMRLRERTLAALDQDVPLQQALQSLRRDLQGVLPPGGLMAWDFKCGAVNGSLGQSFGLQFSTTTGIIRDNAPWGDLQQVTYELRDPLSRNSGPGRDLIRTVTRDLLTTTALDYDEQTVLGNVDSVEFACYDGLNWRDLWDTSLMDTNLPTAVRVRIQMAGENNAAVRNQQPYELLIPLVTQSRTNSTQQTTTSGQ